LAGSRAHGELVLMSAELELAAWTIEGEKLWSTFAEPPWTYRVVDRDVHFDMMGVRSTFDLLTGPSPSRSKVKRSDENRPESH
jgi:hypothetical protein